MSGRSVSPLGVAGEMRPFSRPETFASLENRDFQGLAYQAGLKGLRSRSVVRFPVCAMHNQGDKISPGIKRQGMGTLKNLKLRPIGDFVFIDF